MMFDILLWKINQELTTPAYFGENGTAMMSHIMVLPMKNILRY